MTHLSFVPNDLARNSIAVLGGSKNGPPQARGGSTVGQYMSILRGRLTSLRESMLPMLGVDENRMKSSRPTVLPPKRTPQRGLNHAAKASLTVLALDLVAKWPPWLRASSAVGSL